MSDERLSAWLDDELSPDERTAFDRELAGSPPLCADLDQFAAVRTMVRELALVDPPAGFFDGLVRSISRRHDRARRGRARRRCVGAAVFASAAAWLLVLGFGAGVGALKIVPPLDALANRHATAYAAGDGFSELPMADATSLGPKMSDLPLVSAWHDRSVVQLVYTDATGPISVFRQSGSLDGAHMPEGAETMKVAGMSAWAMEMHDLVVVVVDAGDAVYTVFGQQTAMEHVMTLASAVPPVHRSSSMWDRTTRGWHRVMNDVGL